MPTGYVKKDSSDVTAHVPHNGTTSRVAHVGTLASKIMSGLGYLDYVMIGMSVFGTGRKIFKFFRGKK